MRHSGTADVPFEPGAGLDAKTRFHRASSSELYRLARDTPQTEATPFHPRSPYAGAKLCESYNRQYGHDYRGVMPTNLYGSGDNFHPEDSHVTPKKVSAMRIHALSTVHNRKRSTLASLGDLHAQELPPGTSLSITLVDDASTDGTAAAVHSEFPDVHVLEGPGTLFWAGGMRHGWLHAVRHEPCDALFVFNDDVRLRSDALANLVTTSAAIGESHGPVHAIAGAFIDPEAHRCTYGGLGRGPRIAPLNFRRLPLRGHAQQAYTLNMNGALIRREAIERIGFLSECFTHRMADYDFGLRLRKAGGTVWQAPGHIGTCPRNPYAGTSAEPGLSRRERLRRLRSIKEMPPRERAFYLRRHGGPFWYLFFVYPYLRALLGFRSIAATRSTR